MQNPRLDEPNYSIPPGLRLRDDETTFEHSWDTLAQGIKPESGLRSFNRSMELYRDISDGFFSYLDEMNHFIEIRLVSKKQVASLRYWVQQVAGPRFKGDVNFAPCIDYYGYSGVRGLMDKFEIPAPPLYQADGIKTASLRPEPAV